MSIGFPYGSRSKQWGNPYFYSSPLRASRGGVNKSQGRATPLIFFLYWPTLGESFFFCLAASALPLGKAGQRRTKNSPQSLRVKSARHARPQKVEGLFRGGAILSGWGFFSFRKKKARRVGGSLGLALRSRGTSIVFYIIYMMKKALIIYKSTRDIPIYKKIKY